jgi:dTDP-4-amino-4,6-dideoxygalactose transaminase
VESVPFVDLKAQYALLRTEVLAAMDEVMGRADFILGEPVRSFEREFCQYLGGRFGFGVASGTDALHLALRALEIGPGDEVITVANTFVATALAIRYTGARPVLVDIDPQTYLMDVDQVAAAIGPHTKAIIPVHLFGRAMDLKALLALAAVNSLALVEDACQAHGATLGGKRVGTTGTMGCYSFYPGKNLGGYGDGGFVLLGEPELAQRIQMLRNYGQLRKNDHLIVGYNSRLDSLQAAILRVKLRHLDQWNSARQRTAQLYRDGLACQPVTLPALAPPGSHVYHLFVIEAENRDALRDHLEQHGVSTGIHYPVPVHLQPAFQDLGCRRGQFPVSERAAEHLLSLPIFPEMTESQVGYVCEVIADCHGRP